MFTEAECFASFASFASFAAHGASKTGAKRWTDGERDFRLVRVPGGHRLEAVRVDGRRIGMREALRPLFLARMAEQRKAAERASAPPPASASETTGTLAA